MKRHRYFDKHGNEIDAATALDADGILRDGCSHRVPMSARDSASNTRLRITDATGQHGENGSANRPGWRRPNNPYLKDQTIIAYGDYLDEISAAYLGDRTKKKQKYNAKGQSEGYEVTTEDDPDEDVNASEIER
jgi:hypothetical protein